MNALTTILSIFGGGALLTFLQYLINRHDEKKGKYKALLVAIDEINEELHKIRAEMDEDRATTARIRILRYSDEMRHGQRHSKESFDQVMADIDTYERYCDTHKDFENGKAVMATEIIRRIYKKCLEQNDFLV